MGSDQHDDEALLDEFEQQPSLVDLEDGDCVVLVVDSDVWTSEPAPERYHPDDEINLILNFIVRYDPAAYGVTHDNGGPRITYKRGGQLVVWPYLWDPNVPARREQRIDIPVRPTGNGVTP